jgi:hypothetical protein
MHAQSSWYFTQSYALTLKKPCHIATPDGISMPFTATHFLHQQADLSLQVPGRRNANDFNSDTFINTMTKENGRAAELQNCRTAEYKPLSDQVMTSSLRSLTSWKSLPILFMGALASSKYSLN